MFHVEQKKQSPNRKAAFFYAKKLKYQNVPRGTFTKC